MNVKLWCNATLLCGAIAALISCKSSQQSAENKDAYKDIERTFEDTTPAGAEKKPVEGAELSGLDETGTKRFEDLADRLPSPCGKAHSLRTSRNTDSECRRAPFAVSYVIQLIKDGADNKVVQELYGARYGDQGRKKHEFSREGTPYNGPSDAPVVIFEFFDYGCSACLQAKPVLEEAVARNPGDVVVYYKMFPLGGHPNSGPAAQAALAAHAQGKFKEMHELLFSDQHAHSATDLLEYVGQIGLDLKQYEKDFAAAAAKVAADRQEGIAAGVTGTPGVFINGYEFPGPEMPAYYEIAIKETLAAGL